MGRAPLLLGQGAAVGLWLPAGTAGPALPLPLHGLRPCPSAGTASTEQPLGHLARQGALTAVTLSSPACVLCDQVEEDLSFLGNKEKNCGFYYHPFCAVSSLVAPGTSSKEWFPPFCPNETMLFPLVQLFANGLCEFVEGNSEARFCTEDLIRTVRQAEQKVSTGPEQGALCQERHGELSLVPRKQSRPSQPAPGESRALADEPCSPGSSAECHPALPAPCALPRGVGPAA